MGTTTMQRSIALLIACFLLINTINVDGKRIFGGSSSRKSSGSSGSRTHSSSGSRSHSTGSTYHAPNYESTRLSYSNSHASAPSYSSISSSSSLSNANRGNTFGSSSSTYHKPSAPAQPSSSNPAPIGWNVPKQQGPPPAYSAVNPVGGARTNMHESPPAYKPNNTPVQSSSASQNSRTYTPAQTYPGATNSNSRPYTPAQTYRPRYNSTGGSFGSGGVQHNPISATNAGHGVQSSYPKQQLPAGATYYPSGSSIPAGASYHPAGNVPHGATYYPSNSHLPAGATYHPAGHIPQGAHYYPSGGMPATSYYPSAPAGATYLPAGAALPANAVYYAQPPKSSSGLGFGSGLAAGALGGAILGHALTPSRTYSSYNPGYSQPPAQAQDDKIIIINNGPPGSVSTTNAGDGVTVINAGGNQAQPQPTYNQAASQQPIYSQPAAQPAAVPQTPQPAQPDVNPAGATLAAMPPTNPIDANAATPAPVNPANPATAAEQPPPPGGIICVPVRVPQPDPNDATKTIEVEQIACYPAPPPEPSTVAPPTANTTATAASTTTGSQASITTSDGVSLAAFQSTKAPFVVPEGSVPLAPINPSSQPDLMQMPGEVRPSSTAMLAPGSNLHVASGAMSKYFNTLTFSSLFTLILAYCLH